MKKLAENLYQMNIPLPKSPLRVIQAYIIIGEKRNLLIDTCFNGDESEQAVLAGFGELGITPENTDVFVTHMHVDHSGLIARLKRPGNTIYASVVDAEYINAFQNPKHWGWIFQSNIVAGVPKEEQLQVTQHVAYHQRPERIVEMTRLEMGDVLEAGGYRLEVVDLKGHTPGQIGLWDAEKGFLFCGDHILSGISPNITAWNFEEDYLQYFCDSLERVRGLSVKRLFPAHRAPSPDVNVRIDELLEHHVVRLDIMRGLLKKHGVPMSAYEVAAEVEWNQDKQLKDLPVQQKWFACSETLAHLQHLYFIGEVTRTEDEAGAYRFAIKN